MVYMDFEDIAKYFQDKIEMIVYNLQEAQEITQDNGKDKAFKFVFYTNKGDYHKRLQNPPALKDRTFPEIPVLIKNAGGIQDSSSSIDIYLQKVEFEIYGWCDLKEPLRNQWTDCEKIFSYFCAELKGKTDSLNNSTIKIDTSDYPVANELENKHFLMLLNCNVHIMFNAHLSNMDKIKVNGVEIPYINFTEDFTQELISDNKKTIEVKFMPNVGTYQLMLSGLYVSDNSVVNLMVNGCTTGDLYNQLFSLEIVRDDIILTNRTVYVKNFQTVRSHGSIVAYKATFYPAYTGGV